MFKLLGLALAACTLWAAARGEVHAKSGGLRSARVVRRDEEPRYFWIVVGIYGTLSVALMTIF